MPRVGMFKVFDTKGNNMITGPTAEQLAEFGEPSDELIGHIARLVVNVGHNVHQTASEYVAAMTSDDCIRAHNLLVSVDDLLRARWEAQGKQNRHLLRANAC